jgi:hypothetical protein
MTSTSWPDRIRDVFVLCGAVAVLALMLAIGSCGDSDLVFPGDIPATSTANPTQTATP